jgi:hypothetical protein
MPRHRPNGNDDPRPAKGKGNGLTNRYKAGKGTGPGGMADWDRCEGEALRTLVATVANQGGAVLFGYSRDRGAYRVIIMDDDDKITEWIPCNTDVNEAIWNLAGDLVPPDNVTGSGGT